jgi:hypothetical protein
VYFNGTAGSPQTTSRVPASLNRTTLGALDNSLGVNSYYAGGMAEVAFWTAALSDTDIAVLATGVCPLLVRPEALLAYWPLWGIYSPETDLVGGFNMTVTGTSVIDQPATIQPVGRAKIFLPQAAAFNPTGFPWLANPTPARSRFEVVAY